MNEHEHEWEPYEDIPYGERPERFKRCKICGVIGYIRFSALQFGARRGRPVQPYICSVRGCNNEATDRLKGRRGARNNFIWVCPEHLRADIT